MSRIKRAGVRGLGLVEVLVSVVLALALIGGLLAVITTSTVAAGRIEAQREALTLGRLLLSEPDPRPQSGKVGQLTWQRRITRSPFDFDRVTNDNYTLHRITIEISGPQLSRDMHLETERLLR